jgi:hypothetical protein
MVRVILIIILASYLLVNCGGNNNSDKAPIDSTAAAKAVPVKFELKTFDKENLKGKFEISGTIINGMHWTDKNGDNYVVLTQTVKERTVEDIYVKTTNLFAWHYADFGTGAYREIRKIQDFTKDCEFDNMAAFLPATLSVTDLNKNGFAEVSFMYKLGCKSDVSPDILKLIMMENGEKYALRGETLILMDNTKYGGKKEIDKSFNNAPQEFLNFANELWDKNVQEKF